MSPLTEAMVINGLVLFATLESDVGPHRKIGLFRIVRAPLVVALVIPLFLDRPVTHGNGLLVELAGIAAGLLGGLIVTTLMRVYRSPKTGKPVSAAGWPYALVWTVIVGARAAFSYGAVHWFPAQIGQWGLTHQVGVTAITDGLIFMAITMVLVRTAGLAARATRLPSAPAPVRVAA
jgi:peptidoglycan biosynthesis protein MviN/MurJ (putative lipid II flippase)